MRAGRTTSDDAEYVKECRTCDGETVCEDTWTEGSCCPDDLQ